MNAEERTDGKENAQNEKKLTKYSEKYTKAKNGYIVKITSKMSRKTEKSKYIQKISV